MANNEVRIIGGQWKGRKLRFPMRPDLRPTLGRVRETLFNWLTAVIQDARCLDLYAGSGALGFEALSRGAAEVTFVERDRKAAAALRTNALNLQVPAERVTIVQEPAERYLKRLESRTGQVRFDIIFFDPPFDEPATTATLERLLAQHLEPEGLLYLERPRREALPAAGERLKQGTAGDCQFALLAASP